MRRLDFVRNEEGEIAEQLLLTRAIERIIQRETPALFACGIGEKMRSLV